MNLLKNLTELFDMDESLCSISERMKIVEISGTCKGEKLPKEENIKTILNLFPQRDKVIVTIKNMLDSYLVITSAEQTNQVCKDMFYGEIEEDDDMGISISIEKEILENTLSVYCFNSFVDEIKKLNITEQLCTFGSLLNAQTNLVFDVYDSDVSLSTQSMLFKNAYQPLRIAEFNRLERLEKCKQTSCFYNIAEFPLLPEDFSLIVDYANNPLKNIFRKLKNMLSAIYLASTAVIRNNDLHIQITGQRNVTYQYDISNTEFLNEELYRIYSWTFNGGNSVDKAIIARNIISLHCKYTDLTNIDEKTFASIQTNYALYQKENVSQYIDLKNKLTEYILQVINETSEIVIGMAEKIKNNMLGIVSFIFSVIIINSVSDNPLDSIFTRDITVLIEVILAGSILYMIFSIQEVNYMIKKIKRGYDSLKEGYTELLDDVDKQNIFGDDKVFEDNIMEVNKKKRAYIGIWLGMIILGFIVIESISTSPVLKPIIKSVSKTIIPVLYK